MCYIAGEMVSALKVKHEGDDDPNLKIKDRDILAVKVAALCHDLGVWILSQYYSAFPFLGHCPFSHVYDSLIKKEAPHDLLKKV